MIQFKEALPGLEVDGPVDPALITQVFSSVFAGEWSPTQVAAFAVALRIKKESAEVIAAAAASMRTFMVPLEHGLARTLDTCGTGGDGTGSLNLSSGAAVIAAAAGVPVAKHGNRAVSSRSGSADVLEALGVRIDLTPEKAARVFERCGITFLFAPTYHPAMRFVGPARRELGVRTIFNCIGPLSSPARVSHQLLGAYDDALRPLLAGALRDLGVERAWVVRGEDGMDEMSPFAPTRVTVLDGGRLTEQRLSPKDFGLEYCVAGATDGGDAAENARIFRQVLSGEPHPSTPAFLLNAAASLCVFFGHTPRAAAELAQQTLSSGLAARKLDEWATATQEA